MKRLRIGLTLFAATSITFGIAVVTSCERSDGATASSSDQLTIVNANYQAVGYNMHYASATSAVDPTTSVPRWVVVFNNISGPDADEYNSVGWSYSSDLDASSWTAVTPEAGWEETAWIPDATPTNGPPFTGWRGDNTVAAIGGNADAGVPPTAGSTVALIGVAGNANSDIGMLLSTNAGVTWGSPTYISQPAGGGDVDQPQIVTNANPPYSTFAAWTSATSEEPPLGHPHGWLTSINNVTFAAGSSSSEPLNWTGSALEIIGSSTIAIRPKIAVSTVPCSGDAPHELVWVAWTDYKWGRVCGVEPNQTVNWYVAIFDNVTATWYGQYLIYTDNDFPVCIGSGGNSLTNSNLPTPALAAVANKVSIAFSASTANYGAKIHVAVDQISCSKTSGLNVPDFRVWSAPEYCYVIGGSGFCSSDAGAGNGSDGGYVVNDQWGPAVAALSLGSAGKLLFTWYDSSGDPSNATTRINGVIGTAAGDPFGVPSLIFPIAQASASPPNQSVPWLIPEALWWDYQAVGVNQASNIFLAAWSDGRLVDAGAQAGVWTTVVQP